MLAKYCPPNSCRWHTPPQQCLCACSTKARCLLAKGQMWMNCQRTPSANHVPKQIAKCWKPCRPAQTHCPPPQNQSKAPHARPTYRPTCPWPNHLRQSPASSRYRAKKHRRVRHQILFELLAARQTPHTCCCHPRSSREV